MILDYSLMIALQELLSFEFSFEPFSHEFSTAISCSIVVSNTLGDSRKVGLQEIMKLQIRDKFITQSNFYDSEFLQK